jgi:hypothetical protein
MNGRLNEFLVSALFLLVPSCSAWAQAPAPGAGMSQAPANDLRRECAVSREFRLSNQLAGSDSVHSARPKRELLPLVWLLDSGARRIREQPKLVRPTFRKCLHDAAILSAYGPAPRGAFPPR